MQQAGGETGLAVPPLTLGTGALGEVELRGKRPGGKDARGDLRIPEEI